jgi:hypothetical protein
MIQLFAFVVVISLALPNPPFSSAAPEDCSRALSRAVRETIDEEVIPALGPSAPSVESLPPSCLLSFQADMYHEHENNKSVTHSELFKCGYCNKTFKSEMYLDRHMDNKHMDLIPSDRHHCLADLAPVFGVRLKDSKAFPSESTCQHTEIEKLTYRCTALARR